MTGLPSLLVEVEFSAGVWTDLTESINLASTEIVTSRGRASQSDDGQPGTFSCVFENLDGALTPDNPAGTYYPNVVPGKRLRYTVAGVVRFLGRIVSWDPSYTGNADGDSIVAVTAKDTLGTLQDTEARYPLAVLDALDLDPVALFPLSGEGPAARVTSLFDSPRTIPVSTAAGATGEITYNSSGGPADDMGFLAFGEDLTGKTITDT